MLLTAPASLGDKRDDALHRIGSIDVGHRLDGSPPPGSLMNPAVVVDGEHSTLDGHDRLTDEREQRQRVVQTYHRFVAGDTGRALYGDPLVEHRTEYRRALDETAELVRGRSHAHGDVERAEQDPG